MSVTVALERQQRLVAHLVPAAAVMSAELTAGEDDTVTVAVQSNGVAVVTISYPPVNQLHLKVYAGLAKAFARVNSDASIKAVVLTGSNVFMAGADLAGLQQRQIADLKSKDPNRAEMRRYIDDGLKVFNDIEACKKPVVAAIHKFALGGGLELAMCCHGRVATPGTQLGLPELTLGLIPGLGGTQRLPRLIGVKTALPMMLQMKNIKAEQGLKLRLVDAVVPLPELVNKAGEIALSMARGETPLVRSLFLADRLEPLAEVEKILEAAEKEAKKGAALAPHPLACVAAVRGCAGELRGDPVAGLRVETEQFLGIASSSAARSMVHLFFAKRASAKVPGVSLKPRLMKRFGVVGGGLMGSGIATAILFAGGSVVLKEVTQQFLDQGVGRIKANFESRVKRGGLSAEAAGKILSERLVATLKYEDFSQVECAIEAVFESLKLKQDIFAELEKHCPATALLASNTSTLDMVAIGSKVKDPSRVIGLHFFSPAHLMPLLEIVITPATAKQAIADSVGLASQISKVPIVVGNCPGFVVNRIFYPFFQVATLLVDSGISPYEIDRALINFGLPIGVFRLGELVGIDVQSHVAQTFYDAYPERVYKTPLTPMLVEKKLLGEKTGAGLYLHGKEHGRFTPNPAAQSIIETSRRQSGVKTSFPPHALSDKDIVELCMFTTINESCRVLEEKIALRASDIDVGSVLGMGFPQARGGVMHYADEVGAAKIVATLEKWDAIFRNGMFTPCKFLVERAKSGTPLSA